MAYFVNTCCDDSSDRDEDVEDGWRHHSQSQEVEVVVDPIEHTGQKIFGRVAKFSGREAILGDGTLSFRQSHDGN